LKNATVWSIPQPTMIVYFIKRLSIANYSMVYTYHNILFVNMLTKMF